MVSWSSFLSSPSCPFFIFAELALYNIVIMHTLEVGLHRLLFSPSWLNGKLACPLVLTELVAANSLLTGGGVATVLQSASIQGILVFKQSSTRPGVVPLPRSEHLQKK